MTAYKVGDVLNALPGDGPIKMIVIDSDDSAIQFTGHHWLEAGEEMPCPIGWDFCGPFIVLHVPEAKP